MNDEIRLTVPAKPQMMLVVRMALAGFCSQCGADVDTLDDVRMLADEACYCLMHQSRPVKTLLVTATIMDEQRAHIRFEGRPDLQKTQQDQQPDLDIARGILNSLASDVQLAHDKGDMCAIEVDVHLGPL